MSITRIKMVLTLALVVGLRWCTPSSLPASSAPPVAPLATTLRRAQGVAYYVRTDGGSSDQCTGQTDAPYPGSGMAQPCAWDHPFRALPPDGTPRISGGDILIIAGGGYMMGYGAPGADNCEAEGAYECHMPPIPGGPSAITPTRILGAGWDSGCADPPELWGTQRPWFVVNLTDSSNVEIACLEITDHSSCVEDHAHGMGGSEFTCERDTYPYGPWAPIGLYAEDSANVRLANLNVHGLASAGVHAGRLTDWTVEDVRIAGNGWVGWDGDIEGDDSNSGALTFRRWTVEWNGCGETYPGGQPTGCWAQSAGGYGDGVGTGATGGDWIIEDSRFLHNTSDGLDLLYHSEGGSITLDRVHAEGNAGNQVKATGQTVITNSVLVGNCAFFDGQSFTYNVDPCRALGNTLEVVYTGGERVSIVNSTFYGQGDGLVGGGPREGYSCDGTETLTARNNIFLGDTDYFDPGDISFLFYQEGCGGLKLDSDYNVTHNAKNVECGVNGTYVNSGSHDVCADPQLTGPLTGTAYGMTLTISSPAIDAGSDTVCPAVDHAGNARPVDGDGDLDAVCDTGAYEYGSTSSPLRAAFIAAPRSGQPPLTVTFTNTSSGGYTATLWSLGDGATSTLESFSHVYAAIGAYTVTLTVSGTAGSDVESKTNYIRVWEVTDHVYLPLILRDWATTQSPPQVAGCDVFPADNVWNTPIDTLPVDANSAAYVATIGASEYVHADFGSGEWPPGSGAPIGIPYVDVPGTQPQVPITFDYDDESDPGPYPIPPDAPIEGGPDSDGDRHVLVVDRDDCVLYELYDAWPQNGGSSWRAGSGAIFDLNSHALRPDTWTSADAAGLPILPGLVHYDEVAAGEIRHAIRFTAPETREAHIWPARHDASDFTGPQYPPMGQRFRLRVDFDVSGFSPAARVILQALKKYGMILADNGSSWYISGVPDERWDNDVLHELHQVHGSDFEAVDESSLMIDPDSGQARRSACSLSPSGVADAPGVDVPSLDGELSPPAPDTAAASPLRRGADRESDDGSSHPRGDSPSPDRAEQ